MSTLHCLIALISIHVSCTYAFTIPSFANKQSYRLQALSHHVDDDNNYPTDITRRQALAAAAVASSLIIPPLAGATSSISFGASWRAVDGLNSANNGNFVSFDKSAYRAMRDDPTRTPLFEKAIIQRLGDNPESQVVLDLGTGPFALFALLAAEQGAGKVYAIEANPEAAQSAREFVRKSGYQGVITIVEGYSTQVQLPERVDFCIAEIVGSIASEEGAYATIRNAHRFLKEPTRPDSWIPRRIQTYAAPASYTLHNLFGPPEFDWTKLGGEPVRFNCRDKGLELLSDPVLVEDIDFADIFSPAQAQRNAKKELTFTVDPDRIDENTLSLFDEFRRDKRTSVKESEILAYQTARSFTGIASWPRLILGDRLVVDSRKYLTGDHQRSHWQTVLPIMAERPIGGLKGTEKIKVSVDFTLPEDVTISSRYRMEGVVEV
eukprot:scaffold2215_cov162-Amphora_coffeaeformis.AAC.15